MPPKGKYPRCDRLGELHDVRLDAPVLEREEAPGAAEAGDHLVGDEQHVVPVADLPDAREVVVRGNDDAAGALHGFGDEHRHGVGSLAQDGPFELVRGGHALALAGRRLVAVRVGGGDVREPRHARFEQRPVAAEAGGAHRRERNSVVAVDPGDHLRLVRPAAQLPVGARHLDAAVGRLAAAAREEEAVDRGVAQSRQALGQLDGAGVRAAGVARNVGELGGLFAHRVGKLRPAVPGRYVPQSGEAVDILAPVRVGEDRPVALDPDPRVAVQRLFVQRVDEVGDVASQKVGCGCHGKGVLTGRIARGRATLRDPHADQRRAAGWFGSDSP